MRGLPTLGGPNGFATGANDRGEVVGWAEDTVHDPTCDSRSMLQFRAVEWGPGRHQIRQLPPLPGDTVSAATAINGRGQVVGISCSASLKCQAFLWQAGTLTPLASLVHGYDGSLISANDINDSGVITGQAQTPSGASVAFVARPGH